MKTTKTELKKLASQVAGGVLVAGISLNALAQTNNEVVGGGGNYWCDVEPDGTFGYECTGTNAGSSLSTGDRNVLVGDLAGQALSSGSYNTFVGESAGLSSSTGSDNTFIGHQAGFTTTTGTDNTFVGKQAGFSNTATDGTFVGTQAGYYNTSGFDNTFIGEEAGKYNTTGGDNTFIGEDAGYNNIDGDDNTAVGSWALRSNANGKYNTAVGSEAGYDMSNTSMESIHGLSVRNTVVGQSAGTDIGTGIANTMIGDNAGPNTEYASFNTFVGFQAGFDNNRTNNTGDANRNTALGVYAGYTNREGEDNLWLGALANAGRWNFNQSSELAWLRGNAAAWDPTYDGSSITYGDTTVSRTTVVGANSSGDENDTTTLGYRTRAGELRGTAIGAYAWSTHQDAVVIGYGATSKAADTVVIGSDSTYGNTTSIQPNVDAVTALGTTSYRYSDVVSNKLSVNAAASGAAEIDLFADAGAANDDQWTITAANGGNLSISSYATGSDTTMLTIDNTGNATLTGNLTLNSDARLKQNIQDIANALAMLSELAGKTYEWKENMGRDTNVHYGLLAQDVEQVIPELVVERDGIKSVDYVGVVPVLINAVNELSEQTELQRETLATQQQQIELLKQQIALQQQQLKQQESDQH